MVLLVLPNAELTGRRRQDAKPGLARMYRVPPDRAWWPAVDGPVERPVRPHLAVLQVDDGAAAGEPWCLLAQARPRAQAQQQDRSVLSPHETLTRRHILLGSGSCSTSRQHVPARRRQTSCVLVLPGEMWRSQGAQARRQLKNCCHCCFEPCSILVLTVLGQSSDPNLQRRTPVLTGSWQRSVVRPNVGAKLPAEAGAVSLVRDDAPSAADQAYSACHSGSA